MFIDFWGYLFPAILGFISNISTHRQYFPDQEDATGAAKALMRLQDTYQLDSEAFARGKLPGKTKSVFIIKYQQLACHHNNTKLIMTIRYYWAL